jgi:hypothetical protein
VPDTHYLLSQAELYLELARRMSLRADAEYCRVIAERYAATAAEREAEAASAGSSTEISTASANVGLSHALVLLSRRL